MNRSSILSFLLLGSVLAGCASKNPGADTKTAPAVATAPIAETNDRVIALAEIQPEKKIISLFAETAGSVGAVYHDLNDTLKKGELIASLASTVEEAQLQQAESKLATQLAVINTNKAQLASLTTKAENSTSNYTRNTELIKSGAITKVSLDDSRFTSVAGTRDVTAAAAMVKQAQGRRIELQADVNYARQVIEQKKIRAPYDGTILSMDIRVGNYINANQSIGDFAPAGNLMAITEVDELYAQNIRSGMPAYVRPQGKTDTLATGKVFLVASYLKKKSLFADNAANMEDRRVREVRIILDKGSKVLIGSRVECVIKTN